MQLDIGIVIVIDKISNSTWMVSMLVACRLLCRVCFAQQQAITTAGRSAILAVRCLGIAGNAYPSWNLTNIVDLIVKGEGGFHLTKVHSF